MTDAPPNQPRTGSHAQPTSLELFAGAGGMALGVAQAGFRPALIVELEPRAADTLRANARETTASHVVTADVREMTFRQYRNVDLLAAGPPCQPFSIGGKRVGRHDPRDLLPDTIRVIAETRPKAFMIENVRGLTFPAAHEYLQYSIAQLRNPTVRIGDRSEAEHWTRLKRIPETRYQYHVSVNLLNAADFGVPQQRVRLFIVGVRRDVGDFAWPESTHSKAALIADLCGSHYWERHQVSAKVRDAALEHALTAKSQSAHASTGVLPWTTVRDLFKHLGPPTEESPDAHHKPIPGARLYPKHGGSILDMPAKTVKSGVHGTPGGEHIVVLDDGTYRYFTMREIACLQAFPESFILPSLRSVAQRQLGNAVPVTLAEAVARQFLSALETARGYA
jgi:DNA (cytosine-5)-methyltransferase 1